MVDTTTPIPESQIENHQPFWKSKRFQGVVTLAWTAIVLFFIVRTLAANWRELQAVQWHVNGGLLLLAMVLALLRRFVGGLRWCATVALVNQEPFFHNFAMHMRVYFISNMATYLPGSYWFIPSRIYLNARQGLSALRTTLSIILEQILLLLAGVLVSALYLPTALEALSLPANFPVILVGIIIVGLLLIHPRVLTTIINQILRFRKQEAVDFHASYLTMVRMLVVSSTVWFVGGASLYYLMKAVYSGVQTDILTVSCIFAIAWLVGFFVPIAPAGFGVREGVMFTLFAGIGIPPGMATVISLLSRLLIVAEDVGWFVLVTIYARVRHD